MAYLTGTISASANPSADLYALMAPKLTEAGYILVDTVVTAPLTRKIWQNPAANNPTGKTYYIDLTYVTAGVGGLVMWIMEDFNTTTDLAYRQAYSGTSSNTIETTYYTATGATGYALGNTTGAPANAANVSVTMSLQTSTASFGFWISITPARIAGVTSIAPDRLLYCGAFTPEPFWASRIGADAFPIVTASLDSLGKAAGGNSGSNTTLAVSRLPRANVLNYSSTAGWNLQAMPLWGGYNAYVPSPSVPTGNTSFYGGAQVVWPIGMHMGYGNMPSGATGGWLGSFIDVGIVAAAGTVARGDTITVNGNPWTFCSVASGYSGLFRQ